MKTLTDVLSRALKIKGERDGGNYLSFKAHYAFVDFWFTLMLYVEWPFHKTSCGKDNENMAWLTTIMHHINWSMIKWETLETKQFLLVFDTVSKLYLGSNGELMEQILFILNLTSSKHKWTSKHKSMMYINYALSKWFHFNSFRYYKWYL